MNIKTLEQLLAQEEGISLEFKESLDLESREGKGKFLKDLLALANSPVNQSFLIIGIEDKTKKPVGFTGITEEKIQQIVSRYCRPPIDLEFHSVAYQGVSVGVIQIFHRYKFHTLKESYAYKSNGKDTEILEKAVFIRHGSIVEAATPDEVVDLAQSDAPDMTAVVSALDKITDSLEEIAYSGNYLDDGKRPADEKNRNIETTSIAILTGLIVALLWKPDVLWIPLLILMVAFFFTIIGSGVRLFHFGILRAIITSMVVGAILCAFFLLGPYLLFRGNFIFSDLTLRGIFGVLSGAISGIVGQLIIGSVERKAR